MELAAAQVVETPGKVEQVRGPAANGWTKWEVSARCYVFDQAGAMVTIEERVQRIVEANWSDKEALIHRLAREMHQFRAALPSAADLESIAYHMEIADGQYLFFADGSICNALLMLRRSAALIRLAISELTEPEGKTGSTPPL